MLAEDHLSGNQAIYFAPDLSPSSRAWWYSGHFRVLREHAYRHALEKRKTAGDQSPLIEAVNSMLGNHVPTFDFVFKCTCFGEPHHIMYDKKEKEKVTEYCYRPEQIRVDSLLVFPCRPLYSTEERMGYYGITGDFSSLVGDLTAPNTVVARLTPEKRCMTHSNKTRTYSIGY